MSKGVYAVVSVCTMAADRWEEQQRGLHAQIVPMVSQSPGFVAGYWMGDRPASKTYTTIVLEDEAAARRFESFVAGNPANREQVGVTMESLTTVEVLAQPQRSTERATMPEGVYAVIGVWNMEASHWDEQQEVLHEKLVPMVSQIPGFVAGYWMGDRSASKTYTTIVFEDEAAALGFKALVSGDERRSNQEQSGVSNESLTVVAVLGEARH